MEKSQEIADRLFTFINLSSRKSVDAASFDEAKSALVAASGEDFGCSIDDWMAWYTSSVAGPTEVLQLAHNMYKTRQGIERIAQKKAEEDGH